MQMIDAGGVDRALSFPALIDALDAAFRAEIVLPIRHHHTILRPEGDATQLLMPAWHDKGGFLGVKIVNVFPGNAAKSLPSVMGVYVLMSGETGAPLAVLDGARLTLWRTAAASALAARYLAKPDAAIHLMVGAGALAPFLIKAQRAIRPITRTLLWNRNPARSEETRAALSAEGIDVEIADDLEAACREADIISTATLSTEPLVLGAWLKPGAHLDCVGAFTPAMRETDDDAVLRSRLFADIRESVVKEGGDFAQPMRAGLIARDAIEGDFFDLCRKRLVFLRGVEDITFYKSTGSAILDLAAAALVAQKAGVAA